MPLRGAIEQRMKHLILFFFIFCYECVQFVGEAFGVRFDQIYLTGFGERSQSR